MSYGLALRNSLGELMFSSDFTAFHFVGKFTAVDVGSFRCQASFTSPGRPLVFVDGANGNNSVAILDLVNTSGTSWTVTVGGRTLANAGITSIDVYVFGGPSSPPSTGYGGFVKSASGETTLNLSQRVLKIAAAHQTTLKTSSSASVPPSEAVSIGTIPSNYLVCCTSIGEILTPAGPVGLLLGVAAYRAGATTVGYFGTVIYSTAPIASAYRVFESQYILFADKALYQ